MVAAIHTEGLTKRYGQVEALTDLDLEIAEGEVFGLLGPNGAGKTTTIKLLLDLLRPTRGGRRSWGSTRADGVAVRARVGVVSGDLTPYGDLTGEQLVAFRTLSTGNRQKVALVLALAPDPSLYVLDEPTTGLDPLVQQEFAVLIREARAAGRTVLLSSHVLAEVAHLADRIGILRQGRLVAVEELRTLREPAAHHLEPLRASPSPRRSGPSRGCPACPT